MAMTPAMESIFANAQQNAASLIETATLAINAKVNTIEEAEAMIQELSSEAVKFNELLTCIMNAMRQVESGDMQKEEAAGIIAPAVKELKDKCTALKIANVEAPGDDITEDEIATLRELIIGAKAAAEDRLVAIRLCDDCKVDPEVENELNPPEENGEAFEFDPADEGFISNFMEKRHKAKVDKAKITVMWESFNDKKSEAILNTFGKAASPMLLAGAEGKDLITKFVDTLKESGDPTSDYIIKTVNGVTMGICPKDPEAKTGCLNIIAPVNFGKKKDVDYFFKKEICEAILNPIKESEVTEAMEAYEEIAEEAAFLAAQYVNTTECKTAKALYQNAKKLYSIGSKEKALEYMKKAKSLYEGCLKKLLNESGKFEKAERTDTIKKNSGTSAIRHNVTRTDSLTFAIARSKLETKIDRCTAHILQWTTKAGKETYQQTLDQLKADREQAKAAKKAAKATENYEMEDNTMFNYDEFMFAAESYMDELQLELDTDFAMEADGVEDTSEAPSTIANKLRSALAKFKSAFKRGDKAAAEEAQKEVEAAADEMAAAEDGADEKKKSGLSKAAKIGLTAAGTVAAVAGLTAAGIAISQKAKGEKVDIKGGAKAIKQTIGTAMHNFSENQKNAAASRAVGREEAKQAKLEERNRRADQYFIDQTEKGHAAQIAKDNKAAAKYNAQKVKDAKKAAKAADKLAKIQAKKAAKAAKEAFGISEFDAYEVILEAITSDMIDDADADLASAIEAML